MPIAAQKLILKKYLESYTSLTDEEMNKVLDQIPVKFYPKGTLLLEQGDVPQFCYFVLSGCVRQFMIAENGKETTVNFYTEDQSVTINSQYKNDGTSDYSLSCLEDCVLVAGAVGAETTMYSEYPELEAMTRQMMMQDFGAVQAEFAKFMASSPEERYQNLLVTRPGLVNRVPQHQLASYLGITPESLSRIKKRFLSGTE